MTALFLSVSCTTLSRQRRLSFVHSPELPTRMVVLEPNANNILRKLLELFPSYRSAGEDSFRTQEIIDMFSTAGWRTVVRQRLNLFPNFTPSFIYRLLSPIEPHIEASSFFNALCTVNVFGVVRQ